MTSLPSSLHFVGIAGIGMSGVAQAAAFLGIKVSGSDRAIHAPENRDIVTSLTSQGIRLFAQDGSVYQHTAPEALVYSTAIEEDNPDFACAPGGTLRIHRSEAITRIVNAMQGKQLHAVAGTSGKTTVSAWLTEALYHLNADPVSLCGGLMNRFASPELCGNFRPGQGTPFVIEADESDKSLLNYTPESAILLNIGTDHYSKEELQDVFAAFIRSVRGPSVIGEQAFLEIGAERLKGKDITIFSGDKNAPAFYGEFPVRKLDSLRIENGRYFCAFDGLPEIALPVPGMHSALNALAVHTLLVKLGYSSQDALEAVKAFSGVWRRFDYAGEIIPGVPVYDDYAHNVDKIRSALLTAQSLASGRVFAVFQPHGFAPLRFMREELLEMLDSVIREGDSFRFLPVFYAGGTASFSPTSEEVVSAFCSTVKNPERFTYAPDREKTEKDWKCRLKPGDMVLILGARDNSLSLWAKKIAKSLDFLKN